MDKRLSAEAVANRTGLVISAVLSLIVGMLITVQAMLLSRVISRVYLHQATLNDVTSLIILLAIVILFRAILNGLQVTVNARIAIGIKVDLRQRLMKHLVALGPTTIHGERTGEITTTITEGIETLDAYFRDYIPGLFTATIIPLTIICVVLPVDWLTFAVLLVTAPLIPIFMVLIGKAAGTLAVRQYATLGRMSAHFLDVLQGLTTLKLFNRSKHQITTIMRITDQFRQTTLAVLRVAFLSALALELLSMLSIALVAVEIGLRLLAGGIIFERALFLLIIAPEFYQPLRALGAKFHAGKDGVAAAERIFALLDAPHSSPQQFTSSSPSPLSHFNIAFDDVSFAYKDNRPALHNVSFALGHGEQIALVGASGSGKSTIASLLLRFIEPVQGTITVNDGSLATLDADFWREQIAWVPQSPYIFNVSIADNIRLGRPDAPMSNITKAAQQAAAHDFIIQLPRGYDTLCGERGLRLSGGQAQRIALARAYFKDTPLLILDEATANLDAETEALIDQSLKRLIQGRTVLTIAHRLNTIINADCILVLSEGRIIEQGTHKSLLEQNGLYARMVNVYE